MKNGQMNTSQKLWQTGRSLSLLHPTGMKSPFKAIVSSSIALESHADAIERGRDGRLYFVEPYVEKLTIQELLDKLAPGQW